MDLALTFVRRAFYIIVIALVFSLAYNAVSYINFDPDFGFLRLKEKAIATGWYLPFYYSHVLVAGIILVVGLFQIYPDSHTKFKIVHRIAGYVYVMGILFFAAPGGLVMSLFIDRGPWVLASFLVQSVLWFYFTATAFNKIRKGDITAHQHFMWRSYALTFAAITLRIYIFFTSWSVDLSQPSSYAALAWLSWVPNLFFVEGYIIWKRLNR
jgi:uncharacterized membrane protein YozB (DUF420 family)